ncbi:MAG TPA: hypothetical protein VE775_12100, partial [Pyrinomonadaceae bacterium]|nr:hypothetical protein [Pyrinomonadaceae bacterium]
MLTLILIISVPVYLFAQIATRRSGNASLPPGYWPPEQSRAIIEKTQTVRLAPDLAQLSAG